MEGLALVRSPKVLAPLQWPRTRCIEIGSIWDAPWLCPCAYDRWLRRWSHIQTARREPERHTHNKFAANYKFRCPSRSLLLAADEVRKLPSGCVRRENRPHSPPVQPLPCPPREREQRNSGHCNDTGTVRARAHFSRCAAPTRDHECQ